MFHVLVLDIIVYYIVYSTPGHHVFLCVEQQNLEKKTGLYHK